MLQNIHFPLHLNYDDFKYFRIDVSNLTEFNNLQDEIKRKTKAKQIIPQKVVDRYFSLMADVESIESKHYSNFYEKTVIPVCNYFKQCKGYYFYQEPIGYWDNRKQKYVEKPKRRSESISLRYTNGFEDMIEFVIAELVILDKYKEANGRHNRFQSLEKDTCIFHAYFTMVKYITVRNTSKKQREQLTDYRLGVIASYITHNVFGFSLSEKKTMRNDDYYQAAKIYIKQVKNKYPEYFKR